MLEVRARRRTIHDGHHHVGEHEVDIVLSPIDEVDRLLPVPCRDHAVAVRL